jgi:pyruvate formate lyase activating enzyme
MLQASVSPMTGIVFNIQRFSVHDGPGIRTVVFLKGCTMRCRWCSNPESQRSEPEIAYNARQCLGVSHCGRCGITETDENDRLKIDYDQPLASFAESVKNCPARSLIVYGEERSVDDVLKTVEQDSIFYDRSGGGMTLSGGEPLLQRDFALELLQEAKRRHLDSVVETCGLVPWETLRDASPFLNSILFDIKSLDSIKHLAYTEALLEPVLENFRKLKETYPDLPVTVRTPVVPNFNDQPDEIQAIAEFVRRYPNTPHELLPYHRFGSAKYAFLGREYKI